MIAKVSPLELISIELIKSNYQSIVTIDSQINIKDLFDSYRIEIDFSHQGKKEGIFNVTFSLKINSLKKPKPGYQLEILAFGIFRLDDNLNIDKKLKDNLLFYSSVNMMINKARNIIHQLTSLGPFGVYVLPPIDVVDLFQKKMKKIEKKKMQQEKQN